MPERLDAEEILGRRLRPWWGHAPGRLMTRAVVQGILYGLLGYGCIQVLAGNVDLSDPTLAKYEGKINAAASFCLFLAGIGIASSAIRIIVGALDLTGHKTVEGVLVSAQHRHRGDTLPGSLQWGFEMRRRRQARSDGRYEDDHSQRTRLELVVETPDGPKSWNVGRKHFHESLIGQPVRLTATPLLGYVRNVAATTEGPSQRSDARSSVTHTATSQTTPSSQERCERWSSRP